MPKEDIQTKTKRQRSRFRRSEKHICQSETKFYYMKLHLSFKYPQNVEMFQLFHFQPNGKTKKKGSVRSKRKTGHKRTARQLSAC